MVIMFLGAGELSSLKLIHWRTSKVKLIYRGNDQGWISVYMRDQEAHSRAQLIQLGELPRNRADEHREIETFSIKKGCTTAETCIFISCHGDEVKFPFLRTILQAEFNRSVNQVSTLLGLLSVVSYDSSS